MILFVPLNGTFSKNGAISSNLKGGIMENFPGGKPPDPRFLVALLAFLFSPQYEIRSNSDRKFFQATAKSNVLSTFCSLSVFLMALLFFFFLLKSLVNLCIYAVLMYPVIIIISAMEGGELKVANFHTCAHRSCLVVLS